MALEMANWGYFTLLIGLYVTAFITMGSGAHFLQVNDEKLRIWSLVNLEDEMLASGDSLGLVYIWDVATRHGVREMSTNPPTLTYPP